MVYILGGLPEPGHTIDRTVIDIHFFSIRSLTFYFFDSDYFDSILKNCTYIVFSHVPHYSCG